MGHAIREVDAGGVDAVWVRLSCRAGGKADRKGARAGPRNCPGLSDALRWDPADPRRRAAGSSGWPSGRRSPRLGGGPVVREIAPARSGALDDQPGGHRQRGCRRYRACGPTGRRGRGRPAEGVQAGHRAGAGVRIVEEKLRRRWSPQQIAGWLKLTYPDEPGDAGVTRDHLPHLVRAVTWRAAPGADRSTCAPGGCCADPRESSCPTAGRQAQHPEHLRTTRRGRGPSGARPLGRRPGLRQSDEPGRHPGRAIHPVPDPGRAARRRPQGRRGRRRARRGNHHPARPSWPGR